MTSWLQYTETVTCNEFACDAAFTSLQHAIGQLSQALFGGGIFSFFKHSDGSYVLVVAGATGVSALAGSYDAATATPVGVFALLPSGSVPMLYAKGHGPAESLGTKRAV